jgi:hypothetical protein
MFDMEVTGNRARPPPRRHAPHDAALAHGIALLAGIRAGGITHVPFPDARSIQWAADMS